MLTEPVTCSTCGAVSVNGGTLHCHGCYTVATNQRAILEGRIAELEVEAVNLNARISYLRAKNDELESDLRSMGDRKDNAEARAVGLAVKMARYREALERICDLDEVISFSDTYLIAHEALNPQA